MPRYDYFCEVCGTMELEHKMDGDIKKCPKCKGDIVKQISLPTVLFLGEGWTPKYHNKKE